MRVLYVIDSLVPGGAERSLLALARPYQRRGVELEVAYLYDRPGLQDDLRAAGAAVVSLAGPGGRSRRIERLRRLIRQRRADLVHTTLFESDVCGRLAAAACRVPVVGSMVSVPYGHEHRSDPQLRAWKVRGAQALDIVTARLVTRFHANAEHVATVMSARLRVPRNRIDVVPRGRDPADLGTPGQDRRLAARSRLHIRSDQPLVLAAARQEHQKGLDVLLDAMPPVLSRLPDALLLVAGRNGNQTEMLRTAVARLGLGASVRFLGERDDVPDLLVAADVFVLPSRWEGFAGVLLEAMALETPIVATAIPGAREVLGYEHGPLAPPEDPEHLAEAITYTLTDRGAAAAAAARSRRRFAEHFALDSVADQMVSFYSRALAASR